MDNEKKEFKIEDLSNKIREMEKELKKTLDSFKNSEKEIDLNNFETEKIKGYINDGFKQIVDKVTVTGEALGNIVKEKVDSLDDEDPLGLKKIYERLNNLNKEEKVKEEENYDIDKATTNIEKLTKMLKTGEFGALDNSDELLESKKEENTESQEEKKEEEKEKENKGRVLDI